MHTECAAAPGPGEGEGALFSNGTEKSRVHLWRSSFGYSGPSRLNLHRFVAKNCRNFNDSIVTNFAFVLKIFFLEKESDSDAKNHPTKY